MVLPVDRLNKMNKQWFVYYTMLVNTSYSTATSDWRQESHKDGSAHIAIALGSSSALFSSLS